MCTNPQVKDIDVLLASGSSARSVARIFNVPRTNMTRHAKHVQPHARRLAVIRSDDGPHVAADPLEAAIELAASARTPRERIRGLEAVRAATKLALRGADDITTQDAERLGRNIAEAEAAFREAGDYETRVRALAGWRSALLERVDAVQRAPTRSRRRSA